LSHRVPFPLDDMDAIDEIRKILDQLPDDATLEDMQYHIYVRQKIDHGMADVTEGRLLTEEEFDRRMSRWLEP